MLVRRLKNWMEGLQTQNTPKTKSCPAAPKKKGCMKLVGPRKRARHLKDGVFFVFFCFFFMVHKSILCSAPSALSPASAHPGPPTPQEKGCSSAGLQNAPLCLSNTTFLLQRDETKIIKKSDNLRTLCPICNVLQ